MNLVQPSFAPTLGSPAEPRADHAQYLDHWLGVMKADKKAIFAGASKASEAAAFLAALQSGCVSTVPATSRTLRTSGPTRYARSRRLPPATTRELRLHCIPGTDAYCPAIAAASESALHRCGSATQAAPMPSWIADSGLCLLAQKTRYVARHIRLRSRALSGSFARLLGAGTARSLIQIDGSLIPKRGIGQHAVDTALPLGGDNGFDRSVHRLSMPFLFHCQFIAPCSHLSSNRRDRDFSTPSLNFAQDHRPRKVSPQHRVTALAARTGDPGVLLAAPSGNGKGNVGSSYRMIVNSAAVAGATS